MIYILYLYTIAGHFTLKYPLFLFIDRRDIYSTPFLIILDSYLFPIIFIDLHVTSIIYTPFSQTNAGLCRGRHWAAGGGTGHPGGGTGRQGAAPGARGRRWAAGAGTGRPELFACVLQGADAPYTEVSVPRPARRERREG